MCSPYKAADYTVRTIDVRACEDRLVRTSDDSSIEETIERLLASRDEAQSVCPSEVARALDPERWRPLMEPVRTVAREMLRRGKLRVTQKDVELTAEETWSGPVRLRHPYSSAAGGAADSDRDDEPRRR